MSPLPKKEKNLSNVNFQPTKFQVKLATFGQKRQLISALPVLNNVDQENNVAPGLGFKTKSEVIHFLVESYFFSKDGTRKIASKTH